MGLSRREMPPAPWWIRWGEAVFTLRTYGGVDSLGGSFTVLSTRGGVLRGDFASAEGGG